MSASIQEWNMSNLRKTAFKKIEGIQSASANKVSGHAFVILINKKNCSIFPCKKSFGVFKVIEKEVLKH